MIFHRLAGRDLEFPLMLTVERRQAAIHIDAAFRPFDVFTLDNDAEAVSTIEGSQVRVRCEAAAVSRLRLRRLDRATLNDVIVTAR